MLLPARGSRGMQPVPRLARSTIRSPARMPRQWRDRPSATRGGHVPMSRRFLTATLAATLLVILTASAAMAGEVTGNGRKVMTIENSKWGTGLHARSVCAYSGQEDLQFFVDEETDS